MGESEADLRSKKPAESAAEFDTTVTEEDRAQKAVDHRAGKPRRPDED